MDGYLGYVDTGEHRTPVNLVDETATNNVSHPNHYQSSNGIECKDALAAATEGLSGYECGWTWNAIKYLWRWKRKNGDEDLRKAIQCIQFILDEHLKEEMK